MGNFAENLNLGKRVLPSPVIFGTDRCTTFVTFYLQKVEAPKDNSGFRFILLNTHWSLCANMTIFFLIYLHF